MFILLIPLYLIVRLVNLTAIPIFTDEAMYLRWAQIGLNEPSKYLFISLIDGKQPLFIWLTYPVLYLFGDPLIGGRIISVLAGLGTTIFLYLIADLIFKNKKVALFSSFFYIIFPFAAVTDKLALYDSLLGFLFTAVIYFQIKLAKKLETKTALILGVFMGFGFLTKSSASFFVLLSILSIIFLEKKNKTHIVLWLKRLTFAVAIAFLFNLVLYISPLHGMVKQKNEVFLLTPVQFISNPLYSFWGNLKGLSSYFPPYFSWIWIVLLFVSLSYALYKKSVYIFYLFILFFLPFISLAFFAKIIYPRFIFFMTIPLLIIIAWGTNLITERLPKKILKVIFFLLIISLPLYNSFLILTKPTSAYLPQADSEQLLNSWPAGWGVKETIDYLKSRPITKPIFIGTEGTQGLFPYALELYFQEHKNIQIKGYWPVSDIPPEVREMTRTKETYFIYKDTLNPKPQENVQEVFRVRRGIGENWLVLFKILPIR